MALYAYAGTVDTLKKFPDDLVCLKRIGAQWLLLDAFRTAEPTAPARCTLDHIRDVMRLRWEVTDGKSPKSRARALIEVTKALELNPYTANYFIANFLKGGPPGQKALDRRELAAGLGELSDLGILRPEQAESFVDGVYRDGPESEAGRKRWKAFGWSRDDDGLAEAVTNFVASSSKTMACWMLSQLRQGQPEAQDGGPPVHGDACGDLAERTRLAQFWEAYLKALIHKQKE